MANENIRRIIGITNKADQDAITPEELVRRRIREAIGYHSSQINPDDKFVLFGIDGMDYSMFPCGSFNDKDEAKKAAQDKIDEEHLFSDSDSISSTFNVYTMEGIHVPLKDEEIDQ